MVKIQKSFELKIEVIKRGKKKYFLCYDQRTLSYLVGTKGVTGNHHLYGIEKYKNNWIVSVQNVKDRFKVLNHKLEELKEKINIMEQILKGE